MAQSLGFTNFTNMYSSTFSINDTGSSIYIANSTFTNLNSYSNITSAALFGGEAATKALYSGLDTKYY